jgi:effector-binding domain-containing protein
MTTASTPRTDIEEVTLSPRTIVGRRERVAVADLAEFFGQAIPMAAAELARSGIEPAGPPVAVYRQEVGHTFEVTAGFPVTRPPDTDALVQLRLPAGRAVQAVHAGTYATLSETYERLSDWFAERRLAPPGVMWEEYLAGPDAGGEAGCLTRVVFPLSPSDESGTGGRR